MKLKIAEILLKRNTYKRKAASKSFQHLHIFSELFSFPQMFFLVESKRLAKVYKAKGWLRVFKSFQIILTYEYLTDLRLHKTSSKFRRPRFHHLTYD